MALTQRRMTLDEFLELPEEKPALEFVNGVVTQKVPPQAQHSWLQPWICELINTRTRPTQSARASSEHRTTAASFSRVPDVSVYRWDRIPRDKRGWVSNDLRELPDIAIEILSPNQSIVDLAQKCRWYVENGVRAALLVDPDRENVHVFRPDGAPVILTGTDPVTLDDIVPKLSFTVDEVFSGLSC